MTHTLCDYNATLQSAWIIGALNLMLMIMDVQAAMSDDDGLPFTGFTPMSFGFKPERGDWTDDD